ncbi:YafY family transcriptional regulator [Alginatibacterium sediminis]|uniref:YafY family transcriptional regulator n=1 Tax=Alginatibacterium sediminis TaxID=2164068 RepID=A0A420EDQ3_9ALTE|nr:YafY family protein [Alginatibacterium sediminis]RKF18803.1 YafY family transcriptional regulator [Alginatibacterium sediminis]
MRRADRLFQIVQLLRGRRLTTASELAQRLEVSTRTIYRDVQDLSLSGIPIEGEAGLGYMLRKEVDIPPLMFNEAELEALQVGMRMVQAFGGHELAHAAKQTLIKVESVLPQRLKDFEALMYAPDFYINDDEFRHLDLLRKAARERELLQLHYRDAEQLVSQRCIRPLAIYFWRTSWTLLAWCQLRCAFRNFRVDRIEHIHPNGQHFEITPGKEIADYLCYLNKE